MMQESLQGEPTGAQWSSPKYDDKSLDAPLSNEPSTLVAQLADRLRERIIDGSLISGERLKQTQLATIYGVSPIPIREAISNSKARGLSPFFLSEVLP